MDLLRKFNGDRATKENLLEFLKKSIEEDAIKRMYAGEDVSHIKDAKELIDSAFLKLETIFEIKKDHEQPTNQAR